MASIFDQADKTEISIPTLKQLGWSIEQHAWTNWITGHKTIDLFTDHDDWGDRYRVGSLLLDYHFESPCKGYLTIKLSKRVAPFKSIYGVNQEYIDLIFANAGDQFIDYQTDSVEELNHIIKMIELKLISSKSYITKTK